MTERDEERAASVGGGPEGAPGEEREAPGASERPDPERVPDPTPEEAPELLGERSDYPIAWDGDES